MRERYCLDRIIPKEGLLWVDTDSINWHEGNISYSDSCKRVGNLLDIFEERGSVLTCEFGISALNKKFSKSVSGYKKRNKINKQRRKNYLRLRREGIRDASCSGKVVCDPRDRGNYVKLMNEIGVLLEKGRDDYYSNGVPFLVEYWKNPEYEKITRGLNKLDHSFLSATVASGNAVGIFSSKQKVIRAYDESVRLFGLTNCFVSDCSFGGDVKYVGEQVRRNVS